MDSPKRITKKSTPTSEPRAPRRVWPVIAVLMLLLVAALSVAGYFYYQYQKTSQASDEKEIETLAQEIGKIMLLPEGETPTLATVTDKEKLADQPFFQLAENGDKVLIFSNSGRAILYRPSQGKIIDVTTVNVNQPTTEATPAPAAENEVPLIVRVALRNGSKTVGATNTAENQLKTILPNAAVTSKENAEKNDYQKTVVVDITGKSATVATQLVGEFQGEVGSLPEGETAPTDADILILLGGQAAETETTNE